MWPNGQKGTDMQEFINGQLVKTTMGDTVRELTALVEDESTHVVIGKLPVRGQVVILNGLRFVVLSKSDKKGTLHLRIQKPKVSE